MIAHLASAAPANIPSPSSGTLTIGPLSLNAYGLMIALGVVAAVWLFGRRLEQKGIGTREDANAIALWGVVAGVIGARLYHVITDWERYSDNLGDVVKIWQGGLGIPGGLLAGILVGGYVGHVKRGIPLGPGLNAVAPTLPLAQAIGRWGNYFNQELYGRATTLPWGLEIDAAHLPTDRVYPPGTVFHPTFLYESLWNFALCGVLILIDRRYRPAGGRLMAMYVLGYGVGRFWVEGLRIDEADHLGGLRWNQWVAVACIVGGGLYLLATIHKPKDPILPPIIHGETHPAGADPDGDDALLLDMVRDAEPVDDEVVVEVDEVADDDVVVDEPAAVTDDPGESEIVDAEVIEPVPDTEVEVPLEPEPVATAEVDLDVGGPTEGIPDTEVEAPFDPVPDDDAASADERRH
ncbi:MAG: prolipoprotein diacylglyceryl transferase [Ilumatobacteraceae bacterium]